MNNRNEAGIAQAAWNIIVNKGMEYYKIDGNTGVYDEEIR